MSDNEITINPCDIFLIRDDNIIGKLIRFFQRTVDKLDVSVSHTGLFVGEQCDITESICIETKRVVKVVKFFPEYHNKNELVAIYRPINLTSLETSLIIRKAQSFVGYKYGYIKILTHFLDYFLNGKVFFRKLCKNDNSPICSWVVARAFEAVCLNFDVEYYAANPKNIYDFCRNHPEKYMCVYELGKI